MFKFGQIEVASKDFYKQRQRTDIFMINVKKVVLSDKVSCNNGKDWRHIVGYQVDGIIQLFTKTSKNIFSYSVSQYDKNSACKMSFNVSEAPEWMFQYRKIWNEVESQLFAKITTEPIKGEGRYVHDNLKMWKEDIMTNFHGQDVPYDMYCNAMTVLKINSVYKQSKNYYLQVYVEECIYINAKSQHCSMFSGDDGYFEA